MIDKFLYMMVTILCLCGLVSGQACVNSAFTCPPAATSTVLNLVQGTTYSLSLQAATLGISNTNVEVYGFISGTVYGITNTALASAGLVQFSSSSFTSLVTENLYCVSAGVSSLVLFNLCVIAPPVINVNVTNWPNVVNTNLVQVAGVTTNQIDGFQQVQIPFPVNIQNIINPVTVTTNLTQVLNTAPMSFNTTSNLTTANTCSSYGATVACEVYYSTNSGGGLACPSVTAPLAFTAIYNTSFLDFVFSYSLTGTTAGSASDLRINVFLYDTFLSGYIAMFEYFLIVGSPAIQSIYMSQNIPLVIGRVYNMVINPSPVPFDCNSGVSVGYVLKAYGSFKSTQGDHSVEYEVAISGTVNTNIVGTGPVASVTPLSTQYVPSNVNIIGTGPVASISPLTNTEVPILISDINTAYAIASETSVNVKYLTTPTVSIDNTETVKVALSMTDGPNYVVVSNTGLNPVPVNVTNIQLNTSITGAVVIDVTNTTLTVSLNNSLSAPLYTTNLPSFATTYLGGPPGMYYYPLSDAPVPQTDDDGFVSFIHEKKRRKLVIP
jgi:hypothetical protein